MDQGIIQSVKRKVNDLYHWKLLDFTFKNPHIEPPYEVFISMYSIYDCIKDVAEAWKQLDIKMIPKCFEKVLDIQSYRKGRRSLQN